MMTKIRSIKLIKNKTMTEDCSQYPVTGDTAALTTQRGTRAGGKDGRNGDPAGRSCLHWPITHQEFGLREQSAVSLGMAPAVMGARRRPRPAWCGWLRRGKTRQAAPPEVQMEGLPLPWDPPQEKALFSGSCIHAGCVITSAREKKVFSNSRRCM
ncbi:hypothetical protein MHYP_G00014020 [Metynnis hypsauchen]